MKKIAIVSLRFTPGKIGDLLSYYWLYKDLGYETFLVIDKTYIEFINSDIDMVSSDESALIREPDISIIHNASPQNIAYIRRLRQAGKKVIYVLHEPYPGMQGLLSEGKRFPIAVARTVLEYWACILSDRIFLPSEQAVKAYKKHSFINHNYCKVHLIFCDAEYPSKTVERKYFSFIGGFAAAHGTENFKRLLQYVDENDIDIPFKIVTRSNISEFLKLGFVASLIKQGRLTVFHGKPMASEEINNHYRESVCVWNVYTRSTQSGVVGNAFMMGTPVVASRVGSFNEYVAEGKTGFFMDKPDDFKKMISIYHQCRKSQEYFCENCRMSFEANFHYGAHAEIFNRAIGEFN